MERDVFDRETLLDLSVNVIPLGIILFFVVLFVVVAPWGYSPVDTAVQMSLLIAPFAGLAILTYYSGRAIARDEGKLEEESAGAEAGEAVLDPAAETSDAADEDATTDDEDDELESAVEPADEDTPGRDAGADAAAEHDDESDSA